MCDVFVSCFRLERCVRDVAGCGARRAWILLLDTRAEELQRSEDSPQPTPEYKDLTPPARPLSGLPQHHLSLSSLSSLELTFAGI